MNATLSCCANENHQYGKTCLKICLSCLGTLNLIFGLGTLLVLSELDTLAGNHIALLVLCDAHSYSTLIKYVGLGELAVGVWMLFLEAKPKVQRKASSLVWTSCRVSLLVPWVYIFLVNQQCDWATVEIISIISFVGLELGVFLTVNVVLSEGQGNYAANICLDVIRGREGSHVGESSNGLSRLVRIPANTEYVELEELQFQRKL